LGRVWRAVRVGVLAAVDALVFPSRGEEPTVFEPLVVYVVDPIVVVVAEVSDA